MYSERLPYSNLVIMATFLPPGKIAIHFFVKKKTLLIQSPINTANFLGPLVTVLMVFYCMTEKRTQYNEYLCNTITAKAHIVSLIVLLGATTECD